MRFVMAMMAAFFTACSSNSLNLPAVPHDGPVEAETRAPASSPILASDIEIPEEAFDTLWISENPGREIERHLNRITSLFYRGQKFVMDFDSILDARAGKPDSPRDSERAIQRKLSVVRELQEGEREKFLHIYGRLLEAGVETQNGAADAAKAEKLLGLLWEKLAAAAKGPRRFAFDQLVQEMREDFLDFRSTGLVHQVSGPAIPAVFGKLTFHSSEEVEKALDETDPESGLSHGKALAQEAREEAQHLDPEFERAMLEMEMPSPGEKEGREPQSLEKLKPSPHADGNTYGYELPKGTWALTFDDGPAEWSSRILEVLKANNAKGSFFWQAKNALRPFAVEVVKAAKAAGHSLGNHSYSHQNFSRAGTSLELEINESTRVLTSVYGFKPRYFRCPYGACIVPAVPKARRMIAAQGMIHMQWNVDSLDYQDPDPRSVLRRVLQQMKERGRGIILFHDHRPTSSAVLPRLLKEYFQPNAATTRLVTMEELVDRINGVATAPASAESR